MTKRYGIIFFASAIILIGSLVGYGIYVNTTSSAHVAKMAASQYFRVGGAKAVLREMSPVMELGTVNIASTQLADVPFQLNGTLTQILVKPGDKVQAGQLLGEIVNDELPSEIQQAEGKVRSGEASIAKINSLLKINEALANQGAIPRQQYADTLSDLTVANAELDVAKAYQQQVTTRLAGQRIVAPFAGKVLKVYQTEGSVVQAGQSLAMVGDLSAMFMSLKLPNARVEQITALAGKVKLAVQESKLKDTVYASSTSSSQTTGDSDYAVQIMQVDPPLKNPAQYRTVLFKINNSEGLLEPGTYDQTKIYGTNQQKVLAVPLNALQGEDEKFVYVVTPESLLEQRPVKLGLQDDVYVEVKSGLVEGDTVVVSGGEGGLSAGMQVRLTTELPESKASGQ
jgi:macrolide-specific efflux system membrane fusion protein